MAGLRRFAGLWYLVVVRVFRIVPVENVSEGARRIGGDFNRPLLWPLYPVPTSLLCHLDDKD